MASKRTRASFLLQRSHLGMLSSYLLNWIGFAIGRPVDTPGDLRWLLAHLWLVLTLDRVQLARSAARPARWQLFFEAAGHLLGVPRSARRNEVGSGPEGGVW